MKIREQEGFTLIELLIVVVIIAIIAAIAIPGMMRARQAGNESSAIGSIRAITNGEAAYAATCGRGGFAVSNMNLFTPAPGGQPFISPDLQNANVAPKSGYLITISDNNDPGNHDVAAGACNGAPSSRAMYHVSAEPAARGTLGERSFASDHRGIIYYDFTAALANPIPAGLTTFLQ